MEQPGRVLAIIIPHNKRSNILPMKVWIYLDGRQQGPFELEELLDMPVNENTKVWFEGLPKWYPAGYLAEMRPVFDGSLSRPVPPASPVVPTPPPTPKVVQEPAAEVEEEKVDVVVETEGEIEEIEVKEAAVENAVPPATPRPEGYVPEYQPAPPSYLVWGIILTICCCSPLAVGVIIASVCVGNCYANGNYAGAQRASEWAQWLIMATLAFGIVPIILLAILL